MKKFRWKGIMACILSIAMTMSLAGCDKGAGKGSGENGGNGTQPDPSLAKQYVYKCKEVKLPGDNENIISARKTDNGIEILTQEYTWDDNGDRQKITLYLVDKDGKFQKTTELYTEANQYNYDYPEDGEDGEVILFDDGPKGEVPVPLDPEVQVVDLDVNDDVDYTDWNPENYSYENTYYQNGTITDNAVYAIKNHIKEKYENEQYVSENDYCIVCWNKEDGSVKYETPIDLASLQNEDTYSYVSNIIALKNSDVCIFIAGDKQGTMTLKSDGTLGSLKKLASDKNIFDRDPNMALKDDGTLLVSYYNDDWTKSYLTTINLETGAIGQEAEVPSVARSNGFYQFSAGRKTDVIYSGNDGVYGFNIGDTEVKKIMDFINSDLATYGVNNIIELDDNTFFASYYDSTNYETILGIFTYVKPEDIQDKKVIVYAGIYVDSEEKRQIIKFNKSQDEYRITIKDYSIYNTDDDWTAGQTKFNNDIIAGNVPDIIRIDSTMPVDSFVAKGLLADVDELIKADPELSKIEFMDNVFDAYRIGGKLYRVIPRYTVRTWIAKKSLVGEKTGITMDEVKEYGRLLNHEKSYFGTGVTRDMFMNYLMTYGGSDFVDLSTGKCNFNSQNFISLLEYAKSLPTDQQDGDYYDEEYWDNYWQNYQSQYRENRALLLEVTLGDLYSIKYQVNGMMGAECAYVGFPTENGSGSFIDLSSGSYAIYAKSANKDGAWKYLRQFLTEDYQRNEDNEYGYFYGLPVIKSMVTESAKKLMERPYWTDMNGEKVEYDDTYYINGQEIIIQPFSQKQVDELVNFICNVKKPSYYDENVMKIVDEEVAEFFNNAKSAQDVAGNIQNRVQLYVNENR